ncbi:MAG: hypothetical protein ACRDD5_20405 [Silvania sp.]|uniref:hypothetical protein n=1 Tax=Silvania sp. TaxID=3016633 RepID=UPI003EE5E904
MNDLFVQLRQAHRICSSAYNRILPLLEKIPESLDVDFEYWFPYSYAEIKTRKKPIFNEYGEAFLTLYDSMHVYSRSSQKTLVTPTTACVIGVRFVMDSEGVCDIKDRVDEFNERLGADLVTDPEKSESLVIFYIYRPVKRIKIANVLDDLFYVDSDYPYPRTKTFVLNDRIQVANLVFDMSEWVEDSAKVLKKVRKFIDSDIVG